MRRIQQVEVLPIKIIEKLHSQEQIIFYYIPAAFEKFPQTSLPITKASAVVPLHNAEPLAPHRSTERYSYRMFSGYAMWPLQKAPGKLQMRKDCDVLS